MARFTAFVLLLASVAFAGQVSALPALPHSTVPSLHHYTVVRESAYRAIRCEEATQPTPHATANPMLGAMVDPITVSFIIGTDGRVYSPIILSSDSAKNDREVLRALRSWRFVPATCNGVPTETEASFGFGTF